MNQRSRIVLLGSCLYFHLVAGVAITLGACSVRGGIDLTPPRVVIDTDAASSRGRETGPSSREDRQARGREVGPSSKEDRQARGREVGPSSREDRQASSATDLRTSSPAAQQVVDIWKADLAEDDSWSHIKQAKKKMQGNCGCAPEFQPRWDDFANGNNVLAGCPVTAVEGAADTLLNACRSAGKEKVCSKVKTISIQRGTPEGSCKNCMPINQITLQHGVLSYFCMEIDGMTVTGGKGKLAPLFD